MSRQLGRGLTLQGLCLGHSCETTCNPSVCRTAPGVSMVVGGGSWQASRAASSSLSSPRMVAPFLVPWGAPSAVYTAQCQPPGRQALLEVVGCRQNPAGVQHTWCSLLQSFCLLLGFLGGHHIEDRGHHSDLSEPAVGPSRVRGTPEPQIYRKPVPARITKTF